MYVDMWLEEIRFRADGIVAFRWLDIPHGVLFSHPMPSGIGYFLYGFVDVFSHRV